MEPQQVRRALQEAAAATQRQPARTTRGRQRRAPATRDARAGSGRAGAAAAEELRVSLLLAHYPELLRTPEATRAGDLLVHPLARQLHRAAAEQAAETGTLDVRPGWTPRRPAERATLATALMDDEPRRGSPIPPGCCESWSIRLEILRVDAEIDDEHAFAEGSAGAGG